MAKPGRKRDRAQTNRRQKHELDYRAAKYKASKVAVILADKLSFLVGDTNAEYWIAWAKDECRRANREARRK